MTIEPTLQTNSNEVDEQSNPPIATHSPSVEIRRSTREKRPSFKLRSAFSVRIRTIYEPISYREAVKHPYSTQWQKAMKEEFEALDRNKT